MLRELVLYTEREAVMARLARDIGRGRDVLYHGSRRLPAVLRMGRLLPPVPDNAVFFSRSPEIAAYWALRMGEERDNFYGGVLVLDRDSLKQIYRIELTRYAEDWEDEREESIWCRPVNFRRHLLGIVSEEDVIRVVGPPTRRFYPNEYYCWPEEKQRVFLRDWASGERRLIKDQPWWWES
jgi:hypothetical protein